MDIPLASGEVWEREFDFAEVELQVASTAGAKAIAEITDMQPRFRLHFSPPPQPADPRHWPTALSLPAFNATGRID